MKSIKRKSFAKSCAALIAVFAVNLISGCATPPQAPPKSTAPVATPQVEKVIPKTPQQLRQESINKAEDLEHGGQPKKAFEIYMEVLSGGPWDTDLLSRVIQLSQKMNPPPQLPEGFRKQLVFAKTAGERAKDSAGINRAIDEYEQTIRKAPWAASLHLNLALLQEKGGYANQAISSLKLFLQAAPDDPQKRQIQNKIYELEFLAKDTIRKKEANVQKKNSCITACGDVSNKSFGVISNEKQCESIFGSISESWTPTRHNRQEECKNLVRNNHACKALC